MNGLCAPQRRKQALGHVTLVQAKRYASHNKIGIEPVPALRSVVANENAQHGLFVTTSDYLPSARAFAARSSGIITLSSSSDVSAWCRAAGESIVSDKSTLVSREAVTRLIAAMHRHPDARLVHAHTGYNVITNQFALVIKETKYAALLMALPSTVVSDDGYGQRGFEIPALNEESLRRFAKDLSGGRPARYATVALPTGTGAIRTPHGTAGLATLTCVTDGLGILTATFFSLAHGRGLPTAIERTRP